MLAPRNSNSPSAVSLQTGQPVERFRHPVDSGHPQETGGAAVRDSKHPTAGHLPFPTAEWTAFLHSALSP
ncbi:DUF397 domain-containing protein [Nocardiopsis ganjiahuensis]|uniref:DUF397 domain-containing protein n=1 Tax=Nocardiopsis ganjiahuensis TaxID=239984 RepID=UPI000A02599A